MIPLERLVTFFVERAPWGLHPLKILVALLIPVALLWAADRAVGRLAAEQAARDATLVRLPRIRRR